MFVPTFLSANVPTLLPAREMVSLSSFPLPSTGVPVNRLDAANVPSYSRDGVAMVEIPFTGSEIGVIVAVSSGCTSSYRSPPPVIVMPVTTTFLFVPAVFVSNDAASPVRSSVGTALDGMRPTKSGFDWSMITDVEPSYVFAWAVSPPTVILFLTIEAVKLGVPTATVVVVVLPGTVVVVVVVLVMFVIVVTSSLIRW